MRMRISHPVGPDCSYHGNLHQRTQYTRAMGKKSQKGKAVEETPPSDEGPTLTGVLASDFPILCQQVGLPAIPVRTLSR